MKFQLAGYHGRVPYISPLWLTSWPIVHRPTDSSYHKMFNAPRILTSIFSWLPTIVQAGSPLVAPGFPWLNFVFPGFSWFPSHQKHWAPGSMSRSIGTSGREGIANARCPAEAEAPCRWRLRCLWRYLSSRRSFRFPLALRLVALKEARETLCVLLKLPGSFISGDLSKWRQMDLELGTRN